MAVKIVTKEKVEAVVTTQHKQKGQPIAEDVQTEQVGEPKMLEGPCCNVGVEASFTKNLGNFESVKLGVSLHLPCYHGEIDAVFEFGKQWVDTRLNQMLSEL